MKAAVALLRILAAVLVLSCLIGFLVTVYGMMAVFQSIGASGTVNTAVVANNLSHVFLATSAGLLCFPLGVILHWIIAKKTGVFPSWSRQSLFWGSLFMCIAFPVGTLMGGVTLWKLITSDVFRVRDQSPAR
jgi:hypothetical protein